MTVSSPAMTSVQRILAAAGLAPVDRTPVVPVLLQQGARLLGVPLRQYFGNPTRLAEGQTRLIDRFDHDAVFAIPHVVQDTQPWGAGLSLHDDGPPSVARMSIQRFEEILELRVPDPTAHPYLQNTLRAAEDLAARFKGDRLIVGAVIGPFSLPSLLMGTGKFLSLLLNPELRDRYLGPLMDRMLEYTTRWARAQFAAGCDLVVLAEGIASATILREDTFLNFAFPMLERFVAQVDGLIGLEMVGDALPFMDHLRKLPVAAFLIGETDGARETRERLGQRAALLGNVNNIKLLHWSADRVEFEARRVITEAGAGFVLANQGPEIPWGVPDANIEALVRAAHSTGWR
jgi:uroporphyrinogen decarboxylase